MAKKYILNRSMSYMEEISLDESSFSDGIEYFVTIDGIYAGSFIREVETNPYASYSFGVGDDRYVVIDFSMGCYVRFSNLDGPPSMISVYYKDSGSDYPSGGEDYDISLVVNLSEYGIATVTMNNNVSVEYIYFYLYNSDTNALVANSGLGVENSRTWDCHEYMQTGTYYRVKCEVFHYIQDGSESGTLKKSTETSSSVTYIGDNTSSTIGYVSLNRSGVATWSINNNLSVYSMYLSLWDNYDQVGDSVWQSGNTGSHNFSSRIESNGYDRSYYVTLQIDYYDYTTDTGGVTTLTSELVDFSNSGSSINLVMKDIADAIRSKASVSGSLGIRKMIKTLNNLETTGSSDSSSYDSNDFDSCVSKLAKVIRAKGNTSAKLSLIKMPNAIRSITLAPANPLGLSVYIRTQEYPTSPGDIRVEISSNAYMYSGSYAIVTWYSNDIAYDNIRTTNLDGGIVYCNASLIEGYNDIYASVTVYATINGINYSKTEKTKSVSIYINGGGESSGWDHNTLWYYNNDWYDYCPSESITWYSTTCSKCGATIHTESVGRGENCKNTKNGEYCNEYVYWSETDTPLYRCHADLGEGMICNRTGYSYEEGCPEHGLTDQWYQD